MRDFPSCFGENGVQVADASCSVGVGIASQNSATSVFCCKLLGKSCLISIIWSKNLMGQCLSVEIEDSSHQCIFKVDVKPSLFSKRKGSKSLEVNSRRIEIFWDVSMAKFGSGPEPIDGYYIAVVSKGEMVLLVGDLRREAFKKTGAVSFLPIQAPFISKREHISGKRVYCTKAQFSGNGRFHDLRIECDPSSTQDPILVVRIDSKTVIQIKHLQWNFRGNCLIRIDGIPVEVFWDVHNWLFGPCLGNAVFLFHSDKACNSQQFHDELDDRSFSQSFREAKLSGFGFSLILYAWKNE